MVKTRVQELADVGQSIWLDYISRSLLASGRLQELIDQGLRGMTSNPTIFDKAISSSEDYDEDIARLNGEGRSTFEIYDELSTSDIRAAADILKPVYESSNGLDGYVSLEIDPRLANKTEESILEGKRLFRKVDRPNVMIKVPATPAGFPVIEELLAAGINVNVTLIFSLKQYTDCVAAFMKGLKRLAESGGDLSRVRSVASVFVSRIDTAVDQMLEDKATAESDDAVRERLRLLRGKAAVANSLRIFAKFKEIFAGDEFQPLLKEKAEVQRVLWGSTGTKNPEYSDVKYVDELIGRPTVNTLPEKTIVAFLDHGTVKETLSPKEAEALVSLEQLEELGIDVDQVCAKLLDDGVEAFVQSFDSLLGAIQDKTQDLAGV